jgi:hypothetical protein
MCARDVVSQDHDRLERVAALDAAEDELDYAVLDRVYDVSSERPARAAPSRPDRREP